MDGESCDGRSRRCIPCASYRQRFDRLLRGGNSSISSVSLNSGFVASLGSREGEIAPEIARHQSFGESFPALLAVGGFISCTWLELPGLRAIFFGSSIPDFSLWGYFRGCFSLGIYSRNIKIWPRPHPLCPMQARYVGVRYWHRQFHDSLLSSDASAGAGGSPDCAMSICVLPCTLCIRSSVSCVSIHIPLLPVYMHVHTALHLQSYSSRSPRPCPRAPMLWHLPVRRLCYLRPTSLSAFRRLSYSALIGSPPTLTRRTGVQPLPCANTSNGADLSPFVTRYFTNMANYASEGRSSCFRSRDSRAYWTEEED